MIDLDVGEPEISILVPCFNEQDGVAPTIDTLISCCKNLPPAEIIIVNDGSTDATADALAGIAERYSQVRIITHTHNRGYGAALKTGIRASRGRVTMITDADGTYPCEELPRLYALFIKLDADMVVAARTSPNAKLSTLRMIPKSVLRRACEYLTKTPIPDMNSGLRIFNTGLAMRYLAYLPDGFSFTTTITVASQIDGFRVVFEPIEYFERVGSSKIQPFRDTLRFSQLILRLGVYFAPFRLFGPIILILWAIFAGSLLLDIASFNVSDKTILMLNVAFSVTLLTALADMIKKK